jgi:hypothetical protein
MGLTIAQLHPMLYDRAIKLVSRENDSGWRVVPIMRPRWPTVAYQEQHLVACIRDVNTCHSLSIWRLRKGEIRLLRYVSSYIVTTTAACRITPTNTGQRSSGLSSFNHNASCTLYLLLSMPTVTTKTWMPDY